MTFYESLKAIFISLIVVKKLSAFLNFDIITEDRYFFRTLRNTRTLIVKELLNFIVDKVTLKYVRVFFHLFLYLFICTING